MSWVVEVRQILAVQGWPSELNAGPQWSEQVQQRDSPSQSKVADVALRQIDIIPVARRSRRVHLLTEGDRDQDQAHGVRRCEGCDFVQFVERPLLRRLAEWWVRLLAPVGVRAEGRRRGKQPLL